MNLSIGIAGMPNVGKSTLFNALLKKTVAYAANYPFATIEPNVGVVEVPDDRLPVLANIIAGGDPGSESGMTQRPSIVPAAVEFYDIAGLVKGASKGEGLGNKFLSHIREVAAIAHVVRLFEDPGIIHVSNKVDPVSDIQTVETELILADMATLSKQHEPKGKASKEEIFLYEIVQKMEKKMDEGIMARNVQLDDEEKAAVKQLNLLTMKPVIYVFNVSENQLSNMNETKKKIEEIFNQLDRHPELVSGSKRDPDLHRDDDPSYIYLNAKLENDVLALSEEDQKAYLKEYGLEETGLNRLIKTAYSTLGLISFLTAGEKSSSAKASERRGEVRAWTITKGTLAPQAAGVIHTDFEKHFIKADIVPFKDFVELDGWVKARELGKVQSVGKDYVMKDDEVVEFKVGV
ncbi:redox-regulated ATPase YchF [Candidatus Roizmanbacteria bacterium RIFCSPLOWO2_01_FULL_38_12]|uniref:Redox-regulated ATPase YchF n=1 Tax=Candidatus Roizmanbacteria bacterium RIFCSPLOWO2_01_FULL_38_12 TaxID=1802061 RepID=A0A1F7IXF0_9BACT|nr:MAG: redox-regulated ATPase YchF [Candidatus Roizmanbacteria bacterium RIFCSPHIGHO2_01_FULL_38_15]OGK35499.1 MAG: redox-regulated ATPase YchF [Candidatus Roizmanbacteria bacterium RIFCSPHIGHO2_12_FULL_38_13]OGK48029.1 MAG: redox-regulated ATPase YchF [Candidatus Roizmanbacteria bacterium RIFCSPLOWO2_01_FULL_38_12]